MAKRAKKKKPSKKAKKTKPRKKASRTRKSSRKKISKRKPAKKKSVKRRRSSASKKPEDNFLGTVLHYFPKVHAAVVRVEKQELRPGETLRFEGETTRFKQKIESIQMDRKPILVARPRQEIGVQVKSRVREGDKVYKTVEEGWWKSLMNHIFGG